MKFTHPLIIFFLLWTSFVCSAQQPSKEKTAPAKAIHLKEYLYTRAPPTAPNTNRAIRLSPGIYNKIAEDTAFIYYESPMIIAYYTFNSRSFRPNVFNRRGGLAYLKNSTRLPWVYYVDSGNQRTLFLDLNRTAVNNTEYKNIFRKGAPHPSEALTQDKAYLSAFPDYVFQSGTRLPRPNDPDLYIFRDSPLYATHFYHFHKDLPKGHTYYLLVDQVAAGNTSDTASLSRRGDRYSRTLFGRNDRLLKSDTSIIIREGRTVYCYERIGRSHTANGKRIPMYIKGYMFASPGNNGIITIEYAEKAPFDITSTRPNAKASEEYITEFLKSTKKEATRHE